MNPRISLAILAFQVLTVVAQDRQSTTPIDVPNIKLVVSASISSDGQHIAYTLLEPADPLKENKPPAFQLHLYDISSGISYPFFTQSSVGDVAFRPGKPSITFLTKRADDENRSLYEISLRGGEANRIYSFDRAINSYEWSSNGETLAFISTEKKPEKESSPPYSAEIYEENLTYTRAYIVEIGGQVRELSLDGSVHGIHWSPDGTKLAISLTPTPLVDDSYMQKRISIVDASSLAKTGEIEHAAKLGPFKWSPDSKRLAFIAGAHINDPTPGRLWVVDAQGGTPKRVSPDYAGKFEQIQWQDAKTIHYLGSKGAESEFGTVQIDKSDLKVLVLGMASNVLAFSAADNGNIAMLSESADHPTELFLLSEKTKTPARLTDSNPWLKERLMGKQEVIRYKARDGQEVEGILIRPVEEQPGRKYPLITVVHGGPESHFDNGWLTWYAALGQMGAGAGYSVFYPNYRGSTGRGLEFTMSSQGDPAGKEFDDIIDGIDYLIENGLVDKDKVGVTGGSYGGYATGWMSTRYTERFAAGVMFVGISNTISIWGTSDIPEELYLVHSRKRIWDDYEFALKRSPIYYAGQARTPLLIMHGKDDPRVHPGQSMELYRHIKSRTDTPVRLVFYPGEGHGNRNSTARLDYNLT